MSVPAPATVATDYFDEFKRVFDSDKEITYRSVGCIAWLG